MLLLLESQGVLADRLKIGEVATRSGLSVKTIRFYCDEGLIQPISRSAGGYRLFTEAVLAELAMVRTLKAMDIPIHEMSRILEARRSGLCTCDALQTTIRSKAAAIEQKIEGLRHLHHELTSLLSSWEDCGGRKPSSD